MRTIGDFASNKRQTASRHATNAENNARAIKSGGAYIRPCAARPRAAVRLPRLGAARRRRTGRAPSGLRAARPLGCEGTARLPAGGAARRPAACARRLACAMRRSDLNLEPRTSRARIMRERHAQRTCGAWHDPVARRGLHRGRRLGLARLRPFHDRTHAEPQAPVWVKDVVAHYPNGRSPGRISWRPARPPDSQRHHPSCGAGRRRRPLHCRRGWLLHHVRAPHKLAERCARLCRRSTAAQVRSCGRRNAATAAAAEPPPIVWDVSF